MGFNLGDVFVTFKNKGQAFKQGLEDMKGGLSKFAGGVQNAFKKAEAGSKMLLASVTALAAGFTALVVKSIFAAGELEQNMGGSVAVFGKHAKKLQETAREAFRNMGLSTSDYLQTANKMGSLFRGAGFDVEKSMTLSQKAMQRAADVASIMGVDVKFAMESVAGAAKGNFTMMDNLGVAMNDTTIQAYAMEKGINKSTSAMTQQEKIGLAMEMFLDRTTFAAGNYTKENKTFAGALTTLKAAWANLTSELGSKALPVLSGVFNKITGFLLNDPIGKLKQMAPTFIIIGGAILGALLPAVVALTGSFIAMMAPLIPFMAVGAAVAGLLMVMSKRMGGWGKMWDTVKTKAKPVIDVLKQVDDAAKGVFEIVRLLITGDFRGGIFGMAEDSTFVDWLFRIRDGFREFWNLLQQGAAFIGGLVIGAFNLLWGAIKFLWPSIKSLGETFIKDLLPALKQIWDAVVSLWQALNPALMTAIKIIGAILGGLFIGAIWLIINGLKVAIAVISGVISVISNLIKWIANVIRWYGNFYGAVINAVKGAIGWFSRLPGNVADVIGKIVNWFKSLPDKIGRGVSTVGEKLLSPFKWAFNKIASFWNSTVGKLKFKAPDWVPGLGGKGFEMPQLPTLALGTPGWQGGMAMLGEHGREAAFLPKGTVVRSAQDTEDMMRRSGGDTNIFNLSGVFARTDSELADMMERGIRALDRKRQANGKKAILGGNS